MKHVIQHTLDVATAKKVADRAFAEYRTRYPGYDPVLTWQDDRYAKVRFNAKGVHLDGGLRIGEKTIEFELDVPFVFRIFQKRAIEIVDTEVKVWLEKAKKGEL